MTSRTPLAAVDDAVGIHDLGVDDTCVPPAVHRRVIHRGTRTPFSSTGPNSLRASNPGRRRELSPVSTVAKTMDENLNSLMMNDQSNRTVDNVDNPSGKIHSCTCTDGGSR